MKEKKNYSSPVVEILDFLCTDVLMESVLDGFGQDGYNKWWL